MKMSTKILIFMIIMIIVSVSLIASMVMVQNAVYNEKVSKERVSSALVDLNDMISDMMETSQKSVVSIAQNYWVINAVEINDFNKLKIALDDLNKILKMDTISITDPEGNVIIRQHQPDKLGDSILSQSNVKNALEGTTSTTIEPGALVKLSCRSGTPIYDGNGKIIGTVVGGYTFQNSEILDKLKKQNNTELTIFAGNETIATTISKNSEQIAGMTLEESISESVLENGQDYIGKHDILGSPFLTRYEPLRDTSGNIVGALSAALSVSEAQASTINTLLYILIAVPIIIIICSFIMLWFVNSNIKAPMLALTQASEMLADGHLDIKIDINSKKDEIAKLADAMKIMILRIRNYISDINHVLTAMSENDFTVRSNVEYVGDFLPIKEALTQILASLNETLLVVNSSTVQFSNSANQLSTSAQQLAQGSLEQTETIFRLTDSISHISEEAGKNAKNVSLAKQYVEQTVSGVFMGNKQMKDMLLSMDEIKDSSDQINKIIKTIDDIAFQTNILALNAAVEAARAGTAGKGFAVVADEVRSLASKSAEAAWQTSELINNAISAVDEGYKLADKTADIFKVVTEKVGLAENSILEIDKASTMQSIEITQITEGLKQISDVVQMNSATSEETAAASEELSSQSEVLKDQLSRFNLSEDCSNLENTYSNT